MGGGGGGGVSNVVMLYNVFILDMGLKYVLYWSADYMFECCVNEGYQMWSS